jgi:uncharacterized membrane protein YfcA
VPALRSPTAALVALGLVAGVFAALFGVGGGIVVIPVLLLVFAFDARTASATSLAAIGLTAAFGVVVYSAIGRVDWADAALVGVPAIAGGLVGGSLQRRLSSRALTLAFAAFLVAIAVVLLVQ